MTTPIFRPDQWILYQQGETGGFGQIAGASFDGKVWRYSLQGVAILNTTFIAVAQEDITHAYESGSWIEARRAAGGQASAYTDQN